MDDLNLILSNPLSEPDPVLKSQLSSDAAPRAGQGNPETAPFLQERGKQPRTSEVFRGLGAEPVDATHPASGTVKKPGTLITQISPDPETLFEGSLLASDPAKESRPTSKTSSSDDLQLGESTMPWALLLFMSYSSAVTLALTWVLWTGRTFRSPEAPLPSASATDPESLPKAVDSTPLVPSLELPAENVVKIGEVVRLGDLEIKPLDIVSDSIDLVRSIEPPKRRREESPALVLRLRLTNTSAQHRFAPVERRFLREQTAAVDRSSIVTSNGKSINLFPLAVDSEWSIAGQEFPVLEPGETTETLIVSEPVTENQLTEEMTWRVRVRIGPFRTDVLGVRFGTNDVDR